LAQRKRERQRNKPLVISSFGVGKTQLQSITAGGLQSPVDRSSKQELNKEILELNHNIDQMNLADVYRIFHPTSAQYTSFQQPMEISPTLIKS
jgi:hypothetical protein